MNKVNIEELFKNPEFRKQIELFLLKPKFSEEKNKKFISNLTYGSFSDIKRSIEDPEVDVTYDNNFPIYYISKNLTSDTLQLLLDHKTNNEYTIDLSYDNNRLIRKLITNSGNIDNIRLLLEAKDSNGSYRIDISSKSDTSSKSDPSSKSSIKKQLYLLAYKSVYQIGMNKLLDDAYEERNPDKKTIDFEKYVANYSTRRHPEKDKFTLKIIKEMVIDPEVRLDCELIKPLILCEGFDLIKILLDAKDAENKPRIEITADLVHYALFHNKIGMFNLLQMYKYDNERILDPITVLRTEPIAGLRTEPIAVLRTDPIAVLRTDPIAVLRTDPIAVLRTEPINVISREKLDYFHENSDTLNDEHVSVETVKPVFLSKELFLQKKSKIAENFDIKEEQNMLEVYNKYVENIDKELTRGNGDIDFKRLHQNPKKESDIWNDDIIFKKLLRQLESDGYFSCISYTRIDRGFIVYRFYLWIDNDQIILFREKPSKNFDLTITIN